MIRDIHEDPSRINGNVAHPPCDRKSRDGRRRVNRTRVYEIYGRTERGPFTARSAGYERGSHRWIAEVRAASIGEAIEMATRGQMQSDPCSPGVRYVELDWWHFTNLLQAVVNGWIKIAPHFGIEIGKALRHVELSDEERQALAAMPHRPWLADARMIH